MRRTMLRALRLAALLAMTSLVAGCDDMRVYTSVGFSSYGGGYGGPAYGTSVTIGGRVR